MPAENNSGLHSVPTRLDDALVWGTRLTLISIGLVAGNSALKASTEYQQLQSNLIPRDVAQRMYEIDRSADVVWQLASRLDYRGESRARGSSRIIEPEECPDPLYVQEKLYEVVNGLPDLVGLRERVDDIAKDLPDQNNLCEINFRRVNNQTLDNQRRMIQQLSIDIDNSSDLVYKSGVSEESRNIIENKKLDGLVKVAMLALSSVGALFSFFSFDSKEMNEARQNILKKVKRFRSK